MIDDSPFIAGIVSGGTGDPNEVGDFGVNTRIDVHLDWIQSITETLNITDETDPPSLLFANTELFVDENAGEFVIGFVAFAGETLTYSVSTNRPDMFTTLSVDGSGSLGSVVFETATNQRGTTQIIVTATADGLSTAETLTVTVDERNDPPTIDGPFIVLTQLEPRTVQLLGISPGIGESGDVRIQLVDEPTSDFFESIDLEPSPDFTSATLTLTPSAEATTNSEFVNVEVAEVEADGTIGRRTIQSILVQTDLVTPTVSVDTVNDMLNDANPSTILLVEFSEDVSGFDVTDLTAEHGTLSSFETIDATRYSVEFTAIDGIEATGSVTVGTDYVDLAENQGIAGSRNLLIDTDNASAVIVDVTPDPRTDAVGIVSVTFDQPVTGVSLDDFTLKHNDMQVDILFAGFSGSGSNYTLDLSDFTAAEGTYALTLIAAGSDIQDAGGNALSGDASDEWSGAAASGEATGGDATVGDVGGESNEDLTLSLDGNGDAQLSDDNNSLFAGDGTTQVDDDTILFDTPLDAVTINGGAGDDTLTVDLRNGNPVPGGSLTFNGGTGGNDSLIVIDQSGSSITIDGTYLPDAVDGSARVVTFVLDGGDSLTITFTGLEPTEVSGSPAFTFVSPNGTDVITVGASSGSGGENALDTSGITGGVTFETLTAFNIGDFTIDLGANDAVGGSGVDSLTISSGLDSGVDLAIGLQDLTIDLGVGAGDTLTVDSIIDIPGTLSVDGFETIALNVAALDIGNAVTGTNGIDKQGTGTLTLSGASTFTGASVVTAGTLQVDGSTAAGANFTVQSGTSLTGSGTLGGTVSVASGATLSPGVSGPGALGTGALTLSSGSTFDVQVASGTPGTGHDQVSVTGSVDVSGATLTVDDTGFTATGLEQIILIDNDGSDAVTGTFDSLTEGVVFTVGGRLFEITYVGGDGNDVVLRSDITAPTADIVDVTPDPRSIPAGIVTVNFDENVTGVDISDFSLTHTAAS